MNTKDITIKKVELIDRGLKGLKVTYVVPSENNKKVFYNERVEKLKHPTHLAIDKLFNELRHPLLDICEIISEGDKMAIDYQLTLTQVTSIEVAGDSIKLKGTKEVVGEKVLSLSTPKISEEDNYPNFEGLVAIMQNLFEEVKVYMRGDVKGTNEEVAVKIVTERKKDRISISDLEAMPEAERKEFLSKAIEEHFGGSVLFPEDFTLGEVEDNHDIQSAVEVEVGEEFIVPEDGVPITTIMDKITPFQDGIVLDGGEKEEVVLPA